MMNITDKYDVIVIGAGIGDLTCGAFLAKDGLSMRCRPNMIWLT
jgi:phytoene dehydrogenase-like protein